MAASDERTAARLSKLAVDLRVVALDNGYLRTLKPIHISPPCRSSPHDSPNCNEDLRQCVFAALFAFIHFFVFNYIWNRLTENQL